MWQSFYRMLQADMHKSCMSSCLSAVLILILYLPVSAVAAEPGTSAAALSPVVVAAPKPAEESLIDRKVYQVSSDLQSTFGSVSDVLGVIPSVTVDSDGLVALRGDTHVLILLDGKPAAQFAGRSAGENLLSFPAENIERIEVLSAPPAQFKADGAAGVINIITRKNHAAGLHGQVQAGAGPQGREALGTTANWQDGPLSGSASINFRQEVRQVRRQSTVNSAASANTPASDSQVLTDETLHRSTPTIALAGEAMLDPRQSLNAALNWSNRGGLRTYSEQTSVNTPGVGITSAASRFSIGHDPETDVDARFGYSRKLAQMDGTLDLSLHQSGSHQHEHYDYSDRALLPGIDNARSSLDLFETHTVTDVAIDYGETVGEQQKLKLGYAFQLDNYGFTNGAGTFDPGSGAIVANPDLSNQFQYRQRLHSAYASYQVHFAGWTGLAGLRAEQTLTESFQVTTRSYQPNQYFKAYPSLHLDHALSDNDTLSFGLAQRVTRPEPETLNPFIDREYTPNLQAGNPALLPQITQSLELGAEHETETLRYGITIYGRHNRNSATDVTQYLGNGFSLTTKANLPRNDAAGLEFVASARLGPRLDYSASGNLVYNQIDATATGQPGLQSSTGLNIKTKVNYQTTGGDTLQASLSRVDRRLTPQGYFAAVRLVNLGYRHPVDRQFSLLATISDLLNEQRNNRILNTPVLSADYLRQVGGRVLYVGAIYRFGAGRKTEDSSKFEYAE